MIPIQKTMFNAKTIDFDAGDIISDDREGAYS